MDTGRDNDLLFGGRVFVPSAGQCGVEGSPHLQQYIHREFPPPKGPKETAVYSVPAVFKGRTEQQAGLAEGTVWQRMLHLNAPGTWCTFFHGATYAGHSVRNHRRGRLMVREHDFAIFVKGADGLRRLLLAEVKSTSDNAMHHVVSDARQVKNHKRSAQHQLRDHLEVLQGAVGALVADRVLARVLWPLLGRTTRDPQGFETLRWPSEASGHVFKETLSDQATFDKWFRNEVLEATDDFQLSEQDFEALLHRFVVLSCGVFLEEIQTGLLAFLTREQMALLDGGDWSGGPVVVHGAAGTGKSLLVLRKLVQLWESGRLHEGRRALYMCYWPAVREDMAQRLKRLGIGDYVDTGKFCVWSGWKPPKGRRYAHVFVDETENWCLSLQAGTMLETLTTIHRAYHEGNCPEASAGQPCRHDTYEYRLGGLGHRIYQKRPEDDWGDLWFTVDLNQAALFLPARRPKVLRVPLVTLTRVMRPTKHIFELFRPLYTAPKLLLDADALDDQHQLCIGHDVLGPPVLWASDRHQLLDVVVDLCSTKGVRPNDLCVMPFFWSEQHLPEVVNPLLERRFVEGFHPTATSDVEHFLAQPQPSEFLISWVLRVKGLEFQAVVLDLTDPDIDLEELEDRRRLYIMASRCTSLLVVLGPKELREGLDPRGLTQDYPFDRHVLDCCFT